MAQASPTLATLTPCPSYLLRKYTTASAGSQPCGIRSPISRVLSGSALANSIASTIRSCSAMGGASNRLSFFFSVSSDKLLILTPQLDRGECLGLPQFYPPFFHQFQRGRKGRVRRRAPPPRIGGEPVRQIA